MDFTSLVILPLLFGSLGVFSLFRLLQRMRARAYLKDAVVVITGATSGLGRGRFGPCRGCRERSWPLAHVLSAPQLPEELYRGLPDELEAGDVFEVKQMEIK